MGVTCRRSCLPVRHLPHTAGRTHTPAPPPTGGGPRVSGGGTRVAPPTLRTAAGGESTRWLASRCRGTPWLTSATALTTVAGAVLQVLPVLLLSRVVDGVAQGGGHSVLVTTGALMGAAALLGAAATAMSVYLIGRLGADLLAQLREAAVRAVLGMPSARIEQVGRDDVCSAVCWAARRCRAVCPLPPPHFLSPPHSCPRGRVRRRGNRLSTGTQVRGVLRGHDGGHHFPSPGSTRPC